LNVIELLASRSEGNSRQNFEVHLATTETPSVLVVEEKKKDEQIPLGLGFCASQPAVTEVALLVVSSILAFSLLTSCPIIVFWLKNSASKIAAKHYERMRGRFQRYKGGTTGGRNPPEFVDVEFQDRPFVRKVIKPSPLQRIEEDEEGREPFYANVSIFRGRATSQGPSIMGSCERVYEDVELEPVPVVGISNMNYQEPKIKRQSAQRSDTLHRAERIQVDSSEKKPGASKSPEAVHAHQDQGACGYSQKSYPSSEI